MQKTEKWIWLPEKTYPENQTTFYSGFFRGENKSYTVAEFKRNYSFSKKVTRAELRFSGDTAFRLYCNGDIIATGPACIGGDYIAIYDENEPSLGEFYAFSTVITPNSTDLSFFAQVRLSPIHLCEFSKCHGGFMLFATLFFEDGSTETVSTDQSWLVRKNGAYNAPQSFDNRITPDEYVNAEVCENFWNSTDAHIPVREEYTVKGSIESFKIQPKETKIVTVEFDKIYSAFVNFVCKTSGTVKLKIFCREADDHGTTESAVFGKDGEYRGFSMHSAGKMVITAENSGYDVATVYPGLIVTHYPVTDEAQTVTSDNELNAVLETCKHTLKICRQTIHLDSPRHCEPLACTGDYYIETLMTLFSFGDMRLAEFDLMRTARTLERQNGKMFHTSYSLIFVKMLYEVYMISGSMAVLKDCEKALALLLKRFDTYIGENGIVDNPPDYMFIDWIVVDGITMHHPPKALGQTCLNMFYFGALDNAEKIYTVLNRAEDAEICRSKKEVLRKSINALLFDSEKGIYFEGLNTPTDPKAVGIFMPQNVEKRYYLKHSNVLAAYFGVCDDETGKKLIAAVMNDEIEGEMQPYFIHFLFDAVYRLDLCDEYTLDICSKWKQPIKKCSKGLVEGFIPPQPDYSFDHSHAWGGTPLYSLPKALMRPEILKAGMAEISLSPTLLGLDEATAELLTPYGKVVCKLKKGEKPRISHPPQIKVHIS